MVKCKPYRFYNTHQQLFFALVYMMGVIVIHPENTKGNRFVLYRKRGASTKSMIKRVLAPFRCNDILEVTGKLRIAGPGSPNSRFGRLITVQCERYDVEIQFFRPPPGGERDIGLDRTDLGKLITVIDQE